MNKIKKAQQGFTVVEGLLLLIVLTLIGGVGFYVYNANRSKDTHKTASVLEPVKNEHSQAGHESTEGWIDYKNTTAKFSLKHPSSWIATTCDEILLMLGSTTATSGKCNSDVMPQMMFHSYEVESGRIGLGIEEYSDLQTEEVTVNGIEGEKQIGTYSYTGEGIGTPPGTKAVTYIFKTNGKIYIFDYRQQPSYPDLKKEFDLIVTRTVQFK